MRRRKFFQTLAIAPAAGALLAQQQPPPGAVAAELPTLDTAAAHAVAELCPHFFDAQQFAALHKLSDILQPALHGVPGALDAKAPEFLDFLVGDSPAERQQ